MPALELDSVCKSFDGVAAVDQLSLVLPIGRICGLLGPNGAGKTTTMRMMAGIIMPDSGSIRIFGEPFGRQHLSLIGYLPEERGLYRSAQIGELMLYFARLRGLSRSAARIRLADLAERFGITAWWSRRVEELSKGMQQKVQLVTTIIHDPQLLILDEPFGGLDPVNTGLLTRFLIELRCRGCAILFSSHHMDYVEKLCDQVCFVNHGRAVVQGPLETIKARFGQHQARIIYRGDSHLFDHHPAIESRIVHHSSVELRLMAGADGQELLRAAAGDGVTILSYDNVSPSLEQIFIEIVGDCDAR
jgi:ABC-2 type transport system ATP-binding protein